MKPQQIEPNRFQRTDHVRELAGNEVTFGAQRGVCGCAAVMCSGNGLQLFQPRLEHLGVTLEPLEAMQEGSRLIAAASIGNVRLIDNLAV